jgi:hypothetical protein
MPDSTLLEVVASCKGALEKETDRCRPLVKIMYSRLSNLACSLHRQVTGREHHVLLQYFIALRWTLCHDESCLEFHPVKYTYVIAVLWHSDYHIIASQHFADPIALLHSA